MYFVNFLQYDVDPNDSTKKKKFNKTFENKAVALNWLLSNGYDAEGTSSGISPYHTNIFWNPKEKICATGY